MTRTTTIDYDDDDGGGDFIVNKKNKYRKLFCHCLQTEMRTDWYAVAGEESRAGKPDCKPSKDVRDAHVY